MAFEEEFSVEVPDEDAEKLQTVGDVVKYIEEKARSQAANSPPLCGAVDLLSACLEKHGFGRVFCFAGCRPMSERKIDG